MQSTDSTNKVAAAPSPTLNSSTSDDQKPKRHSPIKQQQQKVKSEPKSWNKVVSDGQNKMTNIQPNITDTTVPIKTSVAVKKSMHSQDVGNNAQKQRQIPPQKQQPFLAGFYILIF